MKIKTLSAILFAAILIVSGCKKDGDLGGNKIIEGTVYYHDGISPPNTIAPGATVFITYESKISTGNIDLTTTTDSRGTYSVKGMKKGDYFVWGEYTTSSGFRYTTKGHGITIGGERRATLNMTMY